MTLRMPLGGWARLLPLTTLVLASAAWAQGDPRAGAEVALRWCTGCHLIHPATTGPAIQGPPSFEAMARERTPDYLRTFLAKPHAPMPPIMLSRADIENVVAYIESQR
jgi:mono/diheme cytochrome c family protein